MSLDLCLVAFAVRVKLRLPFTDSYRSNYNSCSISCNLCINGNCNSTAELASFGFCYHIKEELN